MPLSGDPDARARQLANLRPGARTAPPGNRRALSHGGYAAVTRDRLDTKVREVYDALAADAPLRDLDGGLPQPMPWRSGCWPRRCAGWSRSPST